MSLYEKLFRFSPTPTRSQLENFLSESLSDLLRRLASVDKTALEDFVCTVLLSSHPSAPFIRQQLRDAHSLCCETRRKVAVGKTYGFPDICVVSDSGVVILLVENKIAARFTTHWVEEDTVTTDIPQLLVYDKWLCEKFPAAALVLLTHIREAPEGFMDNVLVSGKQSAYKLKVRNTCRWLTVASWFTQWHQSSSGEKTEQAVELRMLVREFLDFLKGLNMSTKTFETSDLSTLTAFVEQDIWKKVQQIMESARNVAEHLIPRVGKQATPLPYPGAFAQTQILWDWAYCYDKKLGWYLGWGFSGKDGLKDLGAVLPEPLQAFVVVASEEFAIPLSESQWEAARQKGWYISSGDPNTKVKGPIAVKSIAANVLANKDAGFSTSFQRWLEETLREALRIIEPAHERFKPAA